MLRYHLALNKACTINNWDHAALYSLPPSDISLPDGWMQWFTNWEIEKKPYNLIAEIGVIKTLYEIILFSNVVRNGILKIVNPESGKYVIFIERFNALQLLAFAFAFVRLKKNNISLWLMLRHGPSKFLFVRCINFILIHFIRNLYGKNKFKLITDSVSLAHVLSVFFKIKTNVLPIPNIRNLQHEFVRKNSKLVLWWPGSPRLEKGWKIIQKIANEGRHFKNSKQLQLVVSEESGIDVHNGKNFEIRNIKNILSSEEYDNMMEESNYILLPYDSFFYKNSTSGIFVETIFANKIPLVSDNNWMSNELKNFDLTELIVDDWDLANLEFLIIKIENSDLIKHKLNKLRLFFRAYHSIERYANELTLL